MLAFPNAWQSGKMKGQLDKPIDCEEEGSMTFDANANAVDAIWWKTTILKFIQNKGSIKEHHSPLVGNWTNISNYIKND